MILITSIILLTFLLIIEADLSYIGVDNYKNLDYSNKFNSERDNLKTSELSERIHINNNWSYTEGNYTWCTGSGIYTDPYVIQDLIIDGGGYGNCILIENSYVYFKIENCTVFNSGNYPSNAGIKLSDVNNSLLIDNNCSYNENGISLLGDYNNISGNTIFDNRGFGISLSGDYNNVSGNNINNNDQEGIYLYYNIGDTISGNIIDNNAYSGIKLIDSNNNIIFENNLTYNRGDGINLDDSNNNIVSRNTVNENEDDGIVLLNGNNNILSENSLNNNEDGIHLFSSDYNYILGNSINNNYIGIKLFQSNYNTVSKNILQGNFECITEVYCTKNTFQDNEYCNYGEGISLESIILISTISGIALIGLATLLLIIRKRKRLKLNPK